ncbi:NAD(P)H-dependent flavin oxidoreductase [Haloechinothrix halophila]|uniref:NAD(P)H-dependent flavin oxidoreductase n=1 Tax=Haloechinothrix halophila TaxID=1069073 RepID=UPI00041EBF79|nr:nitronate monooxygenase [Haloechinothrix halophila]
MFDLTELRTPIVAAPMAGGTSTPELAAAVGRAGGLGFLAAGYATPQALAARIRELRERSDAPFGVNLFVPGPVPDVASIAAYREELAAEAARYDVDLPEPDPSDDDRWDEKIALLLSDPVPVVSFTFGAPPADVVADLHRVGTYVVATVTSVAEARAVASLGVDALCVQGPEAGGHSGMHDPYGPPPAVPLLDLLAATRETTSLPLIAAGGIATGPDIAAALRAGAQAVQLGTMYLRTPESGAKPAHKRALADPRFYATVMTRAFSGRPARGLHNRFIAEHDATVPVGYPLVNQLTQPLRAAAASQDDPDGMSLWAGTGYRHAPDTPAETLTSELWESAQTAR